MRGSAALPASRESRTAASWILMTFGLLNLWMLAGLRRRGHSAVDPPAQPPPLRRRGLGGHAVPPDQRNHAPPAADRGAAAHAAAHGPDRAAGAGPGRPVRRQPAAGRGRRPAQPRRRAGLRRLVQHGPDRRAGARRRTTPAKEWAEAFLKDLPPGDSVAVLQAKQQVVPVSASRRTTSTRSAARIARLPATRAAAATGRRPLQEAHRNSWPRTANTAQREIIVLSDGQRHGWADADTLFRWEMLATQLRSEQLAPRPRRAARGRGSGWSTFGPERQSRRRRRTRRWLRCRPRAPSPGPDSSSSSRPPSA